MKKNFLKIAAMLIAAMLLVVSCTQEIAPKNEDNGLVEAKLNVAFGKAINIAPENSNATIYYEYKLTHMWDNVKGGVVYGDNTYEFGSGTYSTAPKAITTASVTPGLWKIEVMGYLTGADGKKTGNNVLYGVTKSYINKNENNIVVYVAPVTDANNKGALSISLEMEDLEQGATTKVNYSIDGGAPVELKQSDSTKNNVHVYTIEKTVDSDTVTTESLAAGFHTITFSLDNGYKGGVTRSFLIIPGQTVSITGSIYPSKFESESASISILSLGTGSLKISTVATDQSSSAPVTGNLAKGTQYNVNAENFTIPENHVGYEVKNVTYEWFWGSEKDSETDTITSSTTTATLTTPTDPGYYALSCIAKCTINYAVGDSVFDYILIGEAVKQDILVE